MIEWSKIENKLGSWASYFKPFYDEGGFDKIYEQLRKEGQTTKIVPEGKDLFKAFELCPANELKTIWLGLSPYYMIKYGVVVADGLAFSCGHTKVAQPSLELLYAGLEDDLYDGLNLNKIENPDLSHLAKQGVLLLNASLSTPEGSADKHIELWRPFMTFFFKEVLIYFSGIPIVFFGKVAQEYEPIVVKGRQHYTKRVEHPSYANRQERPWKHENIFSWTNKILKETINKEIDWLETPF